MRTKEDIQFHGTNGPYNAVPAVNVKVHGYWRNVKLPLALGSSHPTGHPELIENIVTHEGFTHDWIEENVSEDAMEAYFGQTCEDAWEQLQEEAERIYGNHVKVYATGRSGGWAYIDGINTDTDSWDAIEFYCWKRFAKLASNLADSILEDMLVNIYINVWEFM